MKRNVRRGSRNQQWDRMKESRETKDEDDPEAHVGHPVCLTSRGNAHTR